MSAWVPTTRWISPDWIAFERGGFFGAFASADDEFDVVSGRREKFARAEEMFAPREFRWAPSGRPGSRFR